MTIIILLCLVTLANASSCGNSLIPYSLETLANGQPVLGCARPICFGWRPDGTNYPVAANFYRIEQQSDGFTRNDPTFIPNYNSNDLRLYAQQTADCEQVFESTSCDAPDQWVGGIAPLVNVSTSITAYQCCKFEPLQYSIDRGIATVGPGQIVVGGEVYENGKLHAFDYISDIEKKNTDVGIVYDINVKRMPCLDPNDVDMRIKQVQDSDAAIRKFNTILAKRVVVHQVPNVPVGPGEQVPLEGVQVTENAETVGLIDTRGENVVVEEIIEQPGFIENIAVQPPVAPGFPEPPPPFPPQSFLQPVPAQIPQAPIPAQFVPESFPAAPAAQPAYGFYNPAAYLPSFGGYQVYCFTDDTTVKTLSGQTKRMDELTTDDWVASLAENGDLEYVPVVYWVHKVPDQVAKFRKIELDDGTELKLTEEHHIYKTECPLLGNETISEINNISVFASEVEEGDCLYKVDKLTVKHMKVKKVSTITSTGIYSPMTASGNIIVNGVFASCHTVVNSHPLQNSFFWHVNHLSTIFDSFFGAVERRDVPIGMDTVVAITEIVLPKNLISF